VLISDGSLFFFGVQFFRPGWSPETDTEAIVYFLVGCILCFWSVLGIAAEVLSHGWAKRVNVGLPAALAALMVSTMIWLPPLGKYTSDAGEAAAFYFIYASVPAFFAILNFWAYRHLQSEMPD